MQSSRNQGRCARDQTDFLQSEQTRGKARFYFGGCNPDLRSEGVVRKTEEYTNRQWEIHDNCEMAGSERVLGARVPCTRADKSL